MGGSVLWKQPYSHGIRALKGLPCHGLGADGLAWGPHVLAISELGQFSPGDLFFYCGVSFPKLCDDFRS